MELTYRSLAVLAFALLMAAACGSKTSGNLALTPEPAARESAAETVDTGVSSENSPAPSNPRNVPSGSGNAVLISVIDERGLPVEQGTIEISVENQVVPQWNFAYSVDLSSVLPDGLLSLYPPSGRVPSTVSIQVVNPTGEASDTIVIGGDEFWQAVVATDLDYVAVHEFDFAKSGTTSSVVYITQPQP